MPGTPATHPKYGAVIDYGPQIGLGCADCGFDAHEGSCETYTCGSCGVDCIESGCSQHPGIKPRKIITQRAKQHTYTPGA